MLVSWPPVKVSVAEMLRDLDPVSSWREDHVFVGMYPFKWNLPNNHLVHLPCSCSPPVVLVFLSHPIYESKAVCQKTPHGLAANMVT